MTRLKVKDRVILMDDKDYQFIVINNINLYLLKLPHTTYVQCRLRGKPSYLHRVIMVPGNGMDVDHINGDGLDNCRDNLRICTRSQNNGNRRKNKKTTSSFKGVHLRKDNNKWQAYIQKGKGNCVHLGCFNKEEDAARAYDFAALDYFGEFANINFKSKVT